MIDKLILFSIRNKLIVGLFVMALIGAGVYSFRQIPIDAVPDITTNQVQIITQSPTLAAQEVEQFVTFPIEVAMANLPDVEEIRSISRFGISVITVVFEDKVDTYLARQLISEQLKLAESDIPTGFGKPTLGPITTGLGEVYQYVLRKESGFEETYSDMDLRTMNDWIVKRQLAGTPGIIEVSGWGGHEKQYEVAVNTNRLHAMNVTIPEVFEALEANNENTGGSYIEKRYNTYFIRGEGLVTSLEDIENIVVKTVRDVPVLIRDVAEVGFGSSPRYGAITYNGQGEVVGGQVLMLKGENSFEVVQAVKDRVESIQKSLPEGVIIEPYIDRSELISRATSTVTTNLVEGGLIVIFILVLLLGNLRGGLIVASVIPLAMLFAMTMMHLFGVSANLMSLGAIDFGLVVDGSVIIVEAIMHQLAIRFSGQKLSAQKMDEAVYGAASKIRSSAAFGEVIILIVYLPILALVGIEGKMFKPMAQTVSFAIAGALILSMTYVPMMSALFLNKNIVERRTISDRMIQWLQEKYEPVLRLALKRRALVLVATGALFAMSLFTFNRLGGEFIPTLEEGDFALHQILPPGSSLQQSVEVSEKIQQTLLDHFPEIITVVSKIGTAEIATDPMPIEVGDIMVKMKPKEEWTSASSKEEMFEKMEEVLSDIPGVEYEFTQPIQMRFNELIAGVREDIAIKIFGENPDVLHDLAKEAEKIIADIEGVGDLRVEQTKGLPQMIVKYKRNKIAQYGLSIRELNRILRTAFAGEAAGVVFEEERRFDLVVRLEAEQRQRLDDIRHLYVPLSNGEQIPLKEVADIEMKDGPMQISREDAKRRIVIGVNARNRDTESLVAAIQEQLEANLEMPAGYSLRFGGQFENLLAAKARLSVAVPVALILIAVLLFLTFNSVKQALLIFTAIPLSAIGGVFALWVRDMPFSISAGVGFIALFGVAVLNGIVLIAYFNQLEKEGVHDMYERILQGTRVRLRPVIMTAAVAALGFLPMAISTSAGAEVQRPLATVVIGGLISATFLTLLVLPILYRMTHELSFRSRPGVKALSVLFVLGSFAGVAQAQTDSIDLPLAVHMALENHPSIKAAQLGVERSEKLKKVAFELDDTQIGYAFGELNAPTLDYQWQVSQRFRFPTTYLTLAKLQKQKLALSEKQLEAIAHEVEYRTLQMWNQMAWLHARELELQKFQLLMDDWVKAAEMRFDAGESNMLELSLARSKFQQTRLLLGATRDKRNASGIQLRSYIGASQDQPLALQELGVMEHSDYTIGLSANAELQTLSSETDVATRYWRAEQQAFLPSINVGYVNQQIEGVQNLSGLQLGVGVPLFFWGQAGKTKAAKMLVEQKKLDYEGRQLELNNELLTAQAEYRQYKNQVEWYQQEGNKTANQLLRFAMKQFQAGEIGYHEYVNAVEQGLDIKLAYYDALFHYNQRGTEIQFLSGQFERKQE
mgnify:CR=1 FL=1